MRYYLDPVKQKKPRKITYFRLSLGFLLFGFFCQGQVALSKTNVYKEVKPDGQVEYSDQPSQESTEVILPSLQINPPAVPTTTPISEPKAGEPSATEGDPQKKLTQQERVTIEVTSPIEQQFFISSVTEVPVTFVVRPTLTPTQKIKLVLDNVSYGEPQNAASFVLKDLERGAHELKAMVIDDNNQVVATSAPVTFHQQRQTIRKNKP